MKNEKCLSSYAAPPRSTRDMGKCGILPRMAVPGTRDAIAAELRRLRAEEQSISRKALSRRQPALWRKIKRLLDSHAEAVWFAGLGPRPRPWPFTRWSRE